jgi:hypothetical protein
VIESVRHLLAFAVRVDDHFVGEPVAEELEVALSTLEAPVPSPLRRGARQSDGTYRFVGLAPGPRDIRVTSRRGERFTWDATTPVVVPLADPRQPIVIEAWPTPQAPAPLGVVAIRAVLEPPLAGQEVRIDPLDTPSPGKRTRTDTAGELLFVVAGWTTLAAGGRVHLGAVVPGQTVTSVDVIEGGTATAFVGATFDVPPGRETRVRIHLL